MMTNADMIRSMNDEELDAFLTEVVDKGVEWFWRWMCKRCETEHGGKCPGSGGEDCINEDTEILNWLKAEVEN